MKKLIYMSNNVGIGILLNGWGYLLFSELMGEQLLCVFSHFPKITFIQIGQPDLEDNFVW